MKEVSGFPIGKRAARNYLVIPENKRMIVLLTTGMNLAAVAERCEEELQKEQEDLAIYILVSRGGDLGDALRARYGGDTRVQIITFNKQLAVFLEAADEIIRRNVFGGIMG